MDNYNWHKDGYEPEYSFESNSLIPSYKDQKKQKLSGKLIQICILSAVIGGIICGIVFSFVTIGYKSFFEKDNELHFPEPSSGIQSTDTEKHSGTVLSIKEVSRMVGPAVVGVISKSSGGNGFLRQNTTIGSGSGIIISADGYIITNNHVIEQSNEADVVLANGKTYSARIIGKDARCDLAVLKIDETDLPYAKLGDSGILEAGDIAIAIGNPLGQELAGTLTVGYISSTNRVISIDNKDLTLIQTDAAINPGNSGGALCNEYGEVIGINTVKITASGVEGIGFAIPINEAKPVVEDLINVGYVRGRLIIGINAKDVTEELAQIYDLPVGIYVSSIFPFSGAEKAGIKPGDIIVKCEGKDVKTVAELNKIRDTFKAGDAIVLSIMRDGNPMDMSVILQEEKPSTIE